MSRRSGAYPGTVNDASSGRARDDRWNRVLIFRDAAAAAVDNGFAYWLVLVLSGAIATLGLAVDSSAVVIGAMLVAPLLGPIVGLSLALAVGDSRLAVQCFAVVGGSLVAVIATAAALTMLLPFHTLTLEISARIHPTTLDLGIAVCSGLVAALVAVSRGQRLATAIPGVAVAVALIPPLAVAGFGMAAGWQAAVIRGALLLLGANLAGIVLSGVAVFLLIGMHRSDVVEAARQWHAQASPNGVARLVCRLPGMGRAGVFGSVAGRAALVVGFVLALAVPLTAALREVIREARVRGAVAEAVDLLQADGATSVLWRQVELGPDSATARVRVATTVGVSSSARAAFQRRATDLAGEPVHLRLEQLPAAAGDGSALQALLRGGDRRDALADATWPETVSRAREALEQATWSLPFPAGALPLGVTLRVGGGAGGMADSAAIAYLAPAPLEPQAAEVLGGTLRRTVGHPGLRTAFQHAGPALILVDRADLPAVDSIIGALRQYAGLRIGIRSAAGDSVMAAALLETLRSAGVDSVDVQRRPDPGPVELRVTRAGG